jgi:large subunit ribosomal protein L1
MKRSKAYRSAAEHIDRDQLYSPAEAVDLAKSGTVTKFDPTVEVALRLGVDPRKQDQMVRGTVNLPNGTGKTARVLVFATGDRATEAEAAGADFVGSDDMIERIQGGFLDFDGKIEFRTDRHGNLHFVIGKASFDKRALLENYAAALDEVIRLKPAAAKGRYLKKVTMTTTMGPGIPVDPNKTRGFFEEAESAA